MDEENKPTLSLPELSDEAVTLRPVSEMLGPDLYHIMSNKKLMRYVLPPAESIESASKTLGQISSYAPQWAGWWGVVDNHTGRFIGLVMYYGVNQFNRCCSLAYILEEAFQGKGYATRSLKMIMRFIFEELNMNRIEAEVEEENKSSIKLLDRLRFTCEASRVRQKLYLAGSFRDVRLYSLLADDWISPSAAAAGPI